MTDAERRETDRAKTRVRTFLRKHGIEGGVGISGPKSIVVNLTEALPSNITMIQISGVRIDTKVVGRVVART